MPVQVSYVDSTAIYALKDLHVEFEAQDIHLALSNTNKRVMVSLARAGMLELLGPEWHFVRAHDAVQVGRSWAIIASASQRFRGLQ